MLTFIDSKPIQGIGTLKLYQDQSGIFKVTIDTPRGEYEAQWTEAESAYEMYTKVVDFDSMVKLFQLEDVM